MLSWTPGKPGVYRFGFAVLLLVTVGWALGCGDADDPTPTSSPTRGAGVSIPTLDGPVTGGSGMPFVASTAFDLGAVGYTEAEYFISGIATAYVNVGELSADGMWTVIPGDTAAYKTRLLVYRPIERAAVQRHGRRGVAQRQRRCSTPRRTGSRVHTELHPRWLRVGGRVGAIRRRGRRPDHLRPAAPCPLKTMDPERYGSLVHPGDSFSYDIFSQVAQAIRRPAQNSPARRPTDRSGDRRRRVAVGVSIGDVRQRGSSARRHLRRVPGAQPRRHRRAALRATAAS